MTTNATKKHPCADCRQCQHCSDSRCNVCRGQCGPNRFKGMSMQEQIDYFEALARQDHGPGREG